MAIAHLVHIPYVSDSAAHTAYGLMNDRLVKSSCRWLHRHCRNLHWSAADSEEISREFRSWTSLIRETGEGRFGNPKARIQNPGIRETRKCGFGGNTNALWAFTNRTNNAFNQCRWVKLYLAEAGGLLDSGAVETTSYDPILRFNQHGLP